MIKPYEPTGMEKLKLYWSQVCFFLRWLFCRVFLVFAVLAVVPGRLVGWLATRIDPEPKPQETQSNNTHEYHHTTKS